MLWIYFPVIHHSIYFWCVVIFVGYKYVLLFLNTISDFIVQARKEKLYAGVVWCLYSLCLISHLSFFMSGETAKWEKITYAGIATCTILAFYNLSKGHPHHEEPPVSFNFSQFILFPWLLSILVALWNYALYSHVLPIYFCLGFVVCRHIRICTYAIKSSHGVSFHLLHYKFYDIFWNPLQLLFGFWWGN